MMMIQNGWWHHHHHHHHPIARHPSRRPRTHERSRSSRSASPGWSRARAAGKQRRRPFCALGLDREAMRCVSLSSSSNRLVSLRASYRGIILLDIYRVFVVFFVFFFRVRENEDKEEDNDEKGDDAIIIAFVLLLLCLLLDRRRQSLFVSGGQKSSPLSLFEKR